jgi:hypothetical protein
VLGSTVSYGPLPNVPLSLHPDYGDASAVPPAAADLTIECTRAFAPESLGRLGLDPPARRALDITNQ